ncbi:hypothetical protein CAPTEDRAFT_207513 [Capitella teleta]|uniref:Protein FAM72A n=1 Tax=Capitella teleta TaxID=283909 RepID=R7U2S6_CAPTE|nr:hypothetical protein CAPTEDRAFT_207513 [Capitella teleta]|eukprot:ELU00650.1 hypothetical protein CAPTEDRAFT_207513 [Capitella teleta]
MPEKDVLPTFENKRVVELTCKFCGNVVCDRGMKAILLADAAVELYSTDLPPADSVALINASYQTEKCKCRIKDIACLGCGNVVGYTVVQPCRLCLESCNNGHFWMFLSQGVDAMDRVDHTGTSILLWGQLQLEEARLREKRSDFSLECCR